MSELNQKEVNEQMYLFVKQWIDNMTFEERRKAPVMAISYCLARLSKQDELLKEQGTKEAHWIEYPECLKYDGAYSNDQIVCSACKHVFCIIDNCTEEFDYCPHCGAKMEGR